MTTPPGPPSGVGSGSDNQGYGNQGYSDRGYGNRDYADRNYGDQNQGDETTVMPSFGGQQPYGQPSQPTPYGQQSQPNPFEQQATPYGRPGYGQSTYGSAQYGSLPAYGAPGQPYIGQSTPTGATAIIAAILAFLGALHMMFGVLGALVTAIDGNSVSTPGWLVGYVLVHAVINLAIGVSLGAGGVLLLQGKKLGQRLVTIGSGTVIGIQLLSMLFLVITASSMASSEAAAVTIGGGLFTIVLLIFPIATIVMAVLPLTNDWIRAKTAGSAAAEPAAPQQQYGAPQQYGTPQQYGAPQQYGTPQQYRAQQYGEQQQYNPPGPYGSQTARTPAGVYEEGGA